MRVRKRHRSRRPPPDADAADRRFLTTSALLERSGLSREQLWRGRREGGLASGIHYVRAGRRLFWHQGNVRRWLRELGLHHPWAEEAAETLDRGQGCASPDLP